MKCGDGPCRTMTTLTRPLLAGSHLVCDSLSVKAHQIRVMGVHKKRIQWLDMVGEFIIPPENCMFSPFGGKKSPLWAPQLTLVFSREKLGQLRATVLRWTDVAAMSSSSSEMDQSETIWQGLKEISSSSGSKLGTFNSTYGYNIYT